MRHESDSKDNTYWLGMLTHLQAPSVSRKVRILFVRSLFVWTYACLPSCTAEKYT
jgi:hypothetical protein